jgi:hypothetical protein
MARWKLGESDIEGLIASGELQELACDAMDEVHIAQLAALIRGLAKQHGRAEGPITQRGAIP